MASFSTALSGLKSAEEELQTVSNNLANVSTYGYKSQSLSFSSVYEQTSATSGAGDPIQTGNGSTLASTVTDTTDGTAESTGVSSNMALSGNGYFIVETTSGDQEYTRDGSFTTDSSGNLVTSSGYTLLGYPATDGVVDTSATLQAINVGSGVSIPASASTEISVTANLSSETAVDGTATSSSVIVYDSLGEAHTLTISYTKTAENTWTYTVSMNSDELSSGSSDSTTEIGSGTLTFNSDGTLTDISNVSDISISGLADGADDMTLSGPFGTVDDSTITQTSSDSGTSATSTDGYTAGTLSSYAIDSDGTVEGTFSNGKTLALGQVALASFANVQGLKNVGDNCYEATNSSGSAVIGTAGTGGRGTIEGGYVEDSNVSIATEFSKLIVAQQAYSASAKAITTMNQISQATLQMLQ